jgi:LPS export ABC transporter protein LptC
MTAAGCSGQKAEEAAQSGFVEEAQQNISRFNLAGYQKDGKKKWEIEGDSANIISDVVELNGIVARTYDEQTDVTITADNGAVNKSSNEIKLKDNVIIITSDGSRVVTDHLDWKAKEEKVVTDAVVFVENENMKATGKGAVAEPALKKVRLNQQVVMKLIPATTITCDGSVDVDYANNIAIFNKNVKVIDEKGRVDADRMIAYFNQETRKLDKVIARGNVKITRNGDTTYSEEAVYLASEKRVILKGRPKIMVHPKEEIDIK